MSEILFEMISATNFPEKVANIFHKQTRSVVGWESTQYAITPISLLFKLEFLAFVTEIYLHPKIYKTTKGIQILISDDNSYYESVAKVYDFNQGVRVEISAKCKFMKFIIIEKEYGKAASLDFLRIYGHQYFRNVQKSTLFTQKRDRVEQLLLENGFTQQEKWNVDDQTLTTLNDIAKIKENYKLNNDQQRLTELTADFTKVLSYGKRIKLLQEQLQWMNARQKYQQIKQTKDQIQYLSKKRDKYDQKYETSRFQDMICMDDNNNRQQQVLKRLLEEDRHKLQQQRKRREQQALKRQKEVDDEFTRLQEQQEWWSRSNQNLDKIETQQRQRPKTKSNKQFKKQQIEQKQNYQFNNPYVYNQGDADMQKYIKPLISEFGASYLGDPQLLRKYEQLQLLDILGARIWISTHSQNWRQRAAAMQAVLEFSQNQLPQRYKDGKTRNLFQALMEFARVNAEDKVLQIYYTSLKIITLALAPPICTDDVPVALINKNLQKLLPVLIDKISETNARAKQVSLKTLVSIFKHPASDIGILFQECLRICKEELNIKFVPVDKQNVRIVQSRLQIISKILTDVPKIQKKKIDYNQILRYLVEGSLFHSHNDIRVLGVNTLEIIHKLHPEGTLKWYKSVNGLKPNISSQIEARLKIY